MIVIMSDSHTQRLVIESIKQEYAEKASAIIHCGDSELFSSDKIWEGVSVVAGNCDYDTDYATEKLIQADGMKVLVTHGHLQRLNPSSLGLIPELAEKWEADIVCFGHIHRPVAEIIDRRLFINPCSVSQPRGAYQKMYALVTVHDDESRRRFNISYRDLKHQPIEDLQLELEFSK